MIKVPSTSRGDLTRRINFHVNYNDTLVEINIPDTASVRKYNLFYNKQSRNVSFFLTVKVALYHGEIALGLQLLSVISNDYRNLSQKINCLVNSG